MKTISLSLVLGVCLLAPVSNAIAANSPAPTTSSFSANSNTLSPQEWQELRNARQEALKADPDLMVKAQQLALKIRAFQDKLNAAIIVADPKTASIIGKMDNRRPESKAPVSFLKSTK